MKNVKHYGLYYATAKQKVLIVAEDTQGHNVTVKHIVTGKVQAKKLCKERDIIAWNF